MEEGPPVREGLSFRLGYTHTAMITQERIQEVADQIAQQYQPDKVILFGSYGYGDPHEYSDVDLLVVMDYEGRPIRKAIEIKEMLDQRFAMDVLVYKPAQLQQRLEWGDYFLREITQKGRVLYDAAHAGVG